MPASGLPTTDLDRETSVSLRASARGQVNGSVTESVAAAGISSAGTGPSTQADTISGARVAGAVGANVDVLAKAIVRAP